MSSRKFFHLLTCQSSPVSCTCAPSPTHSTSLSFSIFRASVPGFPFSTKRNCLEGTWLHWGHHY
uniref:Uncharacterized protein n=1 Tax=Rhizophora mucronata TaxID=61149 RepID=A0A2P2PAT5_RHIMU